MTKIITIDSSTSVTTEQRERAQAFAKTPAGVQFLLNKGVELELDITLAELTALLSGLSLLGTLGLIPRPINDSLLGLSKKFDVVLTTEALRGLEALEQSKRANDN